MALDGDRTAMAPTPHRDPPAQTTLATRTVSREDIEVAEQLVDHSHGVRGSERLERALEIKQASPSSSGRASYDHARQLTPGERGMPEEPYSPQTIVNQEHVPSGQVCR